jgi:uncharacterized membrane protein
MTKKEFLEKLGFFLRRCEKRERLEVLQYYSELIDDKTETGLTEAEAVSSLGNIKSIAAAATSEFVENSLEDDTRQSAGGGFARILLLCSTPVLVILGGTFLILLVSLFAVFLSLTAALGATTLAALAATFMDTGAAYAAGGMPVLLMSLGVHLFTVAALFMLCAASYRGGKKLVKGVVKLFARSVKKKAGGKVL